MTREEAIQYIDGLHCEEDFPYTDTIADFVKERNEAIDIAIEALSAEYEDYEHASLVDIKEPLKVAVVRCKDCKWYKKIVEKSKSGLCHYDLVARCLHDEDFCSHGERREP